MNTAIPVAKLPEILRHSFKTKRLIGTGNCIGYVVRLERSMLPIHSVEGEVSGADLLAMLGKLDDWDRDISQVRQGLLEIIADQLPALK